MPYKDPEKQRAFKRKWAREYRAKNPDKVAAINRAWDAEHRMARCAAARLRRKMHGAALRELERHRRDSDIERARAKDRAKYARNPTAAKNRQRRRRAVKCGAVQGDAQEAADYESILRQRVYELCGSRGPIEVDHIEALSTGGEHGWENFAGLCRTCNARKHDASLLIHLLR